MQKYFTVRLVKHFAEEGDPYYTVRAREAFKKKSREAVSTEYRELRLPLQPDGREDPVQLGHYLRLATLIELDPEDHSQIVHLELIRLKFSIGNFEVREQEYKRCPERGYKLGCLLKLKFLLRRYPYHLCKVYKRIRYQDDSKQVKVHDWKVKVIQLVEPHAEDYLVVRKMPCPLSHVEEEIQANLAVRFNNRVNPNPILYLCWKVKDISVYSQLYFDYKYDSRFDLSFKSNYYFQQNFPTSARVPTDQQISSKAWDCLYEIYIQELTPKTTECLPYRYRSDGYLERKAVTIKRKKGRSSTNLEDTDSSSEDEDDPDKFKDDDCFWDPVELAKLQLDEYTITRSYIKVTCQKTIDRQDQDDLRIEKKVAKWAHPDVEYQYLMECLELKQCIYESTSEINVKQVEINIRSDEARFRSDDAWNCWLTDFGKVEQFMAQDIQRWRNQTFACSIYNLDGHFLVEAVNVDEPQQRAYLTLHTLKGMRGKILMYYIDQMLKIYSKDQAQLKRANIDQQTGFGQEISFINFKCTPEVFSKRMAKNPDYTNWEWEDEVKHAPKPLAAYRPSVQPGQALSDVVELEKRERAHRKEISQKQMDAAVRVIQKCVRMLIEKRKYLQMKKIHQIIAKCTIKYQFSQNKFVDISIVVQKYFKPQMYHFMIFNHMNKKRRDDIITIKSMTLPRGISEAEANPNAWALVFTQRLKILWHAQSSQSDKIHRMKDAFIDNSIIKEEVIQKVVEVRVYGDDYIQKKLEKKQQMKRQARNSSSDSDLSVDEEEYNLIKIDVKDIKAIIRMIRKKAAALEMGVRGWYMHFDKDDSDEIELNEFIKMIQFLKIKITDRLGIMLFRVFDRQNLGYFNYAQFSDILEKRLKPNYKMIVRMERARFALEGLNIKFPERKKKQKEIVYRDIVKEIPKEIVKEKVVEKKVAVDKIVEKKVVVEKPIYIEKIVEKPIYIEPKVKKQPSVKVVEKEVVIEKPVYVERTIQV